MEMGEKWTELEKELEETTTFVPQRVIKGAQLTLGPGINNLKMFLENDKISHWCW